MGCKFCHVVVRKEFSCVAHPPMETEIVRVFEDYDEAISYVE